MSEPLIVAVPLLDEVLEPPPPRRARALKKHLIQAMRDLRSTRRPDRLRQKTTPEPEGFAARVVRAGCATCQGFCCKGGGDHAYIDERTMYRVRGERPDLDAAAIIGLYMARLAPRAYRNSCLYHGETGCTLGRVLRAELCNAYYCNGLQDFLKRTDNPEAVRIIAGRNGQQRSDTLILHPVSGNGDPQA